MNYFRTTGVAYHRKTSWRYAMGSVLIFIAAASLVWGAPLKRDGGSVMFYLQPYKNSIITFKGNIIKPKSISHIEKTSAVLSIELPRGEESIEVEITHSGFETKKIALSLSNPFVPLIALDKINSPLQFIRRIPTGFQPKSVTFINPTQVVLPLLDDNHIEVVDIESGNVHRLEIPNSFKKRDGYVEAVVILSRREFWVSQMRNSTIHRFSIESLQYIGSITVTGNWTKVLAYNPIDDCVYASNWQSGDISVVSVSTLKEVRKIKTRGVPRGMAFSSDGKEMIAAIFGGANDSDNAGQTARVDLQKGTLVKTIISGGSHRHAVRLRKNSGNDRFAVSEMAHSKVYVIENDQKIAELKVYSNPNTIVESTDGKFLFVSCRGPNNPKSYLLKGFEFGRLITIDLKSQTIIDSVEAGNQPTGLDVSPDGKYLVSSDFLDHAIRVFKIR